MGTNCRLLAKLKDGTYRHRRLDRLYVFNGPFEDGEGFHDGIYTAGGLMKDRDGVMVTNRQFSVDHLTNWCLIRMGLIARASPQLREQEGIHDQQDFIYYMTQLSLAFEFGIFFAYIKDQIEWLGLYDDMHDLYFDLQSEGKTIIDI